MWEGGAGRAFCGGILRRITLHSSPYPCQLLGGQARRAAMLGVFLVSSVVHEYIFCFVLGFFYPVMMILFLVVGGELASVCHWRGIHPEGGGLYFGSWRVQTGEGPTPKTEGDMHTFWEKA